MFILCISKRSTRSPRRPTSDETWFCLPYRSPARRSAHRHSMHPFRLQPACLQDDESFTFINTALALPPLSNLSEWQANRNKHLHHNALVGLPWCPTKCCPVALLLYQSLPCCRVRHAEGRLVTLHTLRTRQLWRKAICTRLVQSDTPLFQLCSPPVSFDQVFCARTSDIPQTSWLC